MPSFRNPTNGIESYANISYTIEPDGVKNPTNGIESLKCINDVLNARRSNMNPTNGIESSTHQQIPPQPLGQP